MTAINLQRPHSLYPDCSRKFLNCINKNRNTICTAFILIGAATYITNFIFYKQVPKVVPLFMTESLVEFPEINKNYYSLIAIIVTTVSLFLLLGVTTASLFSPRNPPRERIIDPETPLLETAPPAPQETPLSMTHHFELSLPFHMGPRIINTTS